MRILTEEVATSFRNYRSCCDWFVVVGFALLDYRVVAVQFFTLRHSKVRV